MRTAQLHRASACLTKPSLRRWRKQQQICEEMMLQWHIRRPTKSSWRPHLGDPRVPLVKAQAQTQCAPKSYRKPNPKRQNKHLRQPKARAPMAWPTYAGPVLAHWAQIKCLNMPWKLDWMHCLWQAPPCKPLASFAWRGLAPSLIKCASSTTTQNTVYFEDGVFTGRTCRNTAQA